MASVGEISNEKIMPEAAVGVISALGARSKLNQKMNDKGAMGVVISAMGARRKLNQK